MSSNILQGVVAFIQCSDAVHNAKAAIHDRLKKNGAKVITRITKEVSHVIFERKRYHSAGTKANEDTKVLVTLYKKFKGVRAGRNYSPIFVIYLAYIYIALWEFKELLFLPDAAPSLCRGPTLGRGVNRAEPAPHRDQIYNCTSKGGHN